MGSQPNEAARGNAATLSTTNPCAYVSNAKAAAALRVAVVRSTEAPLGPTCVFKVKRRTGASMSVEVAAMATELRQMKQVSRSRITGHRAYCGKLGHSLLLVPLADHYVLDVTAACPAARAIARAALHRIKL